MSLAALVLAGEPADRIRELDAALGVDAACRLQLALADRAARWGLRVAPTAAYGCALGEMPPPAGLAPLAADGPPIDRVCAAAATVLDRHPEGVLIARSSTPSLSHLHAEAAAEDLRNGCDVSVGPATHGGWFLLGLAAFHEDLLRATSMTEAFGALLAGGLQLGMLRSERTLETLADLEALRADPLVPAELVPLLG